jgi:hypothetical protein
VVFYDFFMLSWAWPAWVEKIKIMAPHVPFTNRSGITLIYAETGRVCLGVLLGEGLSESRDCRSFC